MESQILVESSLMQNKVLELTQQIHDLRNTNITLMEEKKKAIEALHDATSTTVGEITERVNQERSKIRSDMEVSGVADYR